MRESFADAPRSSPDAGSPALERSGGAVRPAPRSFSDWLSARSARIARRWLSEITGRDGSWDPQVVEFLGEFLGFLTGLLGDCLGPFRGPAIDVWEQASELYGSFGAMRGLAAGEILEEVQLLREILIRTMLREPPGFDGVQFEMGDVVQVSRVVDRSVTHAGVGYTDALFFALFQGTGVAPAVTRETLEELRTQLAILAAEAAEATSPSR